MGKTGYIILAIALVVFLIIIFFVTYVLNKKTPVPKGCEREVDEAMCQGCHNVSCKFYKENKDTNEKETEKVEK